MVNKIQLDNSSLFFHLLPDNYSIFPEFLFEQPSEINANESVQTSRLGTDFYGHEHAVLSKKKT